MQKIAKFEKVSLEQFVKDWSSEINMPGERIEQIYNELVLPKRATVGSAGYDFFAPIEFRLRPHETIKIPTGIRVQIADGWVLQIYPRSGLGFKYRLQMNNTVGIIDSDYYYAKNEGHIFIKMTNETNEFLTLSVSKGEGFAQGIFIPFGITEDDDTTEIREGGFGSTTKK